MHKLVFGAALAFACLGATWASADGVLHTSDGHSAADIGYGSWTHNFSTRPFASESASVVPSATVLSPTNKVVDLHGDLGRHDLTGFRHWLPRLHSDADCVFVSIDTSAGDRWRPGCK
jgi:streptomycin 6-kinase